MKRYIFLLLMIPLMFGCGKHKKEMEQQQLKADSLQNQISQRDETVNSFLSSLNEIEQNLATIKEKEKLITVNTSAKGELKKDAKERINEDIKSIYDLLLKNKKIIASLSKKLKGSNLKIAELNKMIDNLTAQMIEKDGNINDLKEKLAKLNIDVAHLSSNIDSLNVVTKEKEQVIEQKTSELNTAYYIMGTKKELIEKKVVTKEGGFIGLGKIAKLMNTFDKNNFTKIDITKFPSLSINKKKAKLLTTHPAGSFTIEGKDKAESLIISNYQEFWSVSKYLVIIVD
jgi:DNA repair exonuclease SbcCD ATPase subunit